MEEWSIAPRTKHIFMANFNGQLKQNEIFGTIYNMIISQMVFADNIAGVGAELVDRAKVDGGLYGDTKLYYATDALKSSPWGKDAEAANLLALHRPADPACQAITLDTFRQIALTVDNYLTKRAFSTEGTYASFNSVMLGWIGETKRIYDATTYNAYIGTVESEIGNQTREIDVTTGVGNATGEEKARLEGQIIAEDIANLMVDLKDIGRDYNDYGYLRSYRIDDLMFVWNSEVVNKIEKRDLPTIYHQAIVEKLGEHVLPARYFGTVNTTEKAAGAGVRSLIEQDLTKTGGDTAHVFAGDLIPTGYTAPANTSYTVDNSIAFKVIHKRSVPYMSAFEVGTSFFNAKSLTENHYLTWGHNTLDYLKNYPVITVRVV